MTEAAKVAFLFPGQGSQAAGMGKELSSLHAEARQTFEEADEALGYKISELCFEGPDEKLRMTEITQPAILTVSIAAYRVLTALGLKPDFVAGHSLGEYSAHVAAGTMSFADAVRTVRNRGKYMQEAVPEGLGAMAAIIALTHEQVEAACEEALVGTISEVCKAANINSPGQVVISGSKAGVERAAEICKKKGAKRAIMLPVSAPFHCPMMQPAQDRLAVDINALALHDLTVPLLCNVDAKLIHTASEARDTLIRQVTGSVLWARSMHEMISLGVERFVEIGPGTALSGMMRQIDRTKNCVNICDEASFAKAKESFGF